MAAPVERKVQASTGAAAVSGLVLWVLGTYVFKGTVPDAVTTVVYVLVPAATAFAAGYLTRHTSRPRRPSAPRRGWYLPPPRSDPPRPGARRYSLLPFPIVDTRCPGPRQARPRGDRP